MNKFSKNPKLNAVLTEIESQLLSMCDTEKESIEEIKRYMWSYPKGYKDYNIAEHGNLLFTYDSVYEMYRNCGYKSTDAFSLDRIWETYKRQVGYMARYIVKAH